MNKKHASIVHQTHQILHDVENLTPEALENLYGIELRSDGTVFDTTYQQVFPDVQTWATFSAEQDMADEEEDHMRHKGRYDDDEE